MGQNECVKDTSLRENFKMRHFVVVTLHYRDARVDYIRGREGEKGREREREKESERKKKEKREESFVARLML